jgi:hypothetical protein
VQRLFATPNGRKSKQEYSIIIDCFFTKFKEPDYVPVAFFTVQQCCFFHKLNRISSQWTRHYSCWRPLFLVFLCISLGQVYGPKRTATQLLFFFEKIPLKLWQLWILFAFLFRLVGILKLAAILSHFAQILARNCGPSPRGGGWTAN